MTPLTQLQAQMRACRLCTEAGHDIVPGAVFRGKATADVMLIGQAPGVTEVEAKRPFNAGSGRRLFQWLGAAGWDEADFRARHYMTAVTKCYPGRHPSGKGDRVPSRAEQALCRPFLDAELAMVNPRLLLLVGGLAIKLLFPARARLVDLIGTIAYFPPDTPPHFATLKVTAGEWPATVDPRAVRDGRFVVPLPHPSGASLWPNKPANRALIDQAIARLATLRSAWQL